MGLPKGRTNNPGGKPVGTKAKRTLQWEALGDAIQTEHTDRFNRVLSEMPDDKFAEMYIKVLEYFKPKYNRTDLTSDGEKVEIVVLPPQRSVKRDTE